MRTATSVTTGMNNEPFSHAALLMSLHHSQAKNFLACFREINPEYDFPWS